MSAATEIVEIGPERVSDYFVLFDAAFRDFPDWSGCYCAFYDAPVGQSFDPEADALANRVGRAERIRAGQASGLLAYRDGQPVGWCNVAPRSRVPNLRKFAEAIEQPTDDPAVVMCFVIDPENRGTGVATALLEGAVEVARTWGVPWIEGYPANPDNDREGLPWSAAFYKGPLSMYLNTGFGIVRDMGSWSVVRRDLVQPQP